VLEKGSSYTFIDFNGVTISSSDDSIVIGTFGTLGSLNPVKVGTTMVKSSSAFEGLDEKALLEDLLFAGLVRGDGATLLIVLLTGLV
jgi:hypothetical protein